MGGTVSAAHPDIVESPHSASAFTPVGLPGADGKVVAQRISRTLEMQLFMRTTEAGQRGDDSGDAPVDADFDRVMAVLDITSMRVRWMRGPMIAALDVSVAGLTAAGVSHLLPRRRVR